MKTTISFTLLLCAKLLSASIISSGVQSNNPSLNYYGNNLQSSNFRSPLALNGLGFQNTWASNNAGFAANGFSGFGNNVGLANSGLNNVGLANSGLNNVGLANSGLNNVDLGNSGLNNVGLAQTGLSNLGLAQGFSQNLASTNNEVNIQNSLALAQNAALIDNSGVQTSPNGLAQNAVTNSACTNNFIGNDATSIANFGRYAFNRPLVVASRYPRFPGLGIQVIGDDLEVSGLVAVTGKMPFSGAVGLNGNVNTEGTATVNYSCGDVESSQLSAINT